MMGILDAARFSPILFVGLGGAGSRIVNILAGKLQRHPHWDRLRDLAHFVVIDTNKDDLAKNDRVPADGRFLISAFDKRAYVQRKRGAAELMEDPRVTSWIHPDYQFREARGAGAGQIRVESRLGLYYNLEDDRAGLEKKLTALLERATQRDNPWRANEDRVVYVMVYASVAGGTGSGGFIPMAYWLRDLVNDQGWGRPEVTATLMLPSTFLDRVERQLHDDIGANGYAALKELEFLNKLGYPGYPSRIPFVWRPSAPADSAVDSRPYSLVYLVDKPAELSLDRYEHAVADAAFLQIFSPLLGAQAGEYDNYDKHQRTLALGDFSVYWGSYGATILQFPRRDVVRYAALRFAAAAVRDWLVAGGAHPQFRVPWGDPKFERLDAKEKDRYADERFIGWVAWRAGLEEAADERGIFSAVMAQKNAQDKSYTEAFHARLQEMFDKLEALIDLAPVNPGDLTTGAPSLSRQLDGLRRDVAASRTRVMSEYLQATLTDLRADRLFSAFFKEQAVNPLAQRQFLIHLNQREFIGPSGDIAEDAWLREDGTMPDLDAESVSLELAEHNARLVRAAEPGFFGRILDRENQEFARSKRRALQWIESLIAEQRDHLKRSFWRAVEAELRLGVEARLASFRKVAEMADEAARFADDAAERFRADPAVFPDSDIAQYYLDTEVLRDDHARERLWDWLAADQLGNPALIDIRRVFAVITEAFSPAPDQDGRLQARDAAAVVRFVRDRLQDLGTIAFSASLKDANLDLARALDLEARYVSLRKQGHTLEALRQRNALSESVRAVGPEAVRSHLLDKLRRFSDECVVLAHLDRTRLDDPTVKPAKIFYAGVAPAYATDDEGSLATLLREVAGGVDLVSGWNEPDMIVLYRAVIGIPSYFFRRVTQELHLAYRKVRAAPNRNYPLHIDRQFEGEALPDLDPLEQRRARERAAAEAAALREREVQEAAMRVFALAVLAGLVVRGEGGWAWSLRGFERPLAPTLAAAYGAFQALDPILREDLRATAEAAWRAALADPPARRALAERVATRLEQLTTQYAEAVAMERGADRQHLERERAAVEALRAEIS